MKRVIPTRMVLLRMRKRLATATHGHKLLKDKLDGLMTEFRELVDDYKRARREVDEGLPEVLKLFVLAGITSSGRDIETAIAQSSSTLQLSVSRRRLMSVVVPDFAVQFEAGTTTYSLLDTPGELDQATAALKEYFPKILELARLEETMRRMVEEIEKTRRRVNALEYVMIPELRDTIRTITTKLDEQERSTTTRLMKIKEQRLREEREARLARKAHLGA